MRIVSQTEKRVVVQSELIGQVQLSKFSPDFDHGLYKARPWHVVTFGRNFATIGECIDFLKDVEAHWDDESTDSPKEVCHAEMTHSFLALEADLYNCQ